jgi:hypothetical protein
MKFINTEKQSQHFWSNITSKLEKYKMIIQRLGEWSSLGNVYQELKILVEDNDWEEEAFDKVLHYFDKFERKLVDFLLSKDRADVVYLLE